MLSMKEKLSLGRESNGLLKDLKSGDLPMVERLKKGRQRNEITKKLTGQSIKPEPQPEPQPEPEQQSGPKTHRYSSQIAAKVNQGDIIYNAKMERWGKAHRAENALREAGLTGLAIVKGDDSQGYYIEINKEIPVGTVLEVVEYKGRDSGLDVYLYAVRPKTGSGVALSDLLNVAIAYDKSAHIKGDYIEMSTYEINRMAKEKGFKLDLSELPKDGKEYFDDELDTNYIEDQPVEQSDLVKRFLAGEFATVKPNVFVDVMRDVHSEGLELDEIKAQTIEWLKRNPHLIAA
ncbi:MULTISPECIES: hypothetical protein [unclassified Vibrio]|uniref:hypothetical protein n=1 Tax=Vibrio TaxID=662 RepID=UPI0012687CDB|nr:MULTISPECIES: hypothetical protein [unclassified Vibrio]QFT40138.1 hypothetical protein FIU99_27480 [Vibrio sp. THAF64]QGM37961.1 hypothetical protein GGC04_27075 [Vibrio sp. THAF191d]QGN73458.1 hypothetical protein GGC03_27095 [Vibrio sp. THAF191c]